MTDIPAHDDQAPTLGNLRRHNMTMTAYCAGCNRKLPLTVDDLIRLFGEDEVYLWPNHLRWPISCKACRSRKMEWRIAADMTPKGGVARVHVMTGSPAAKCPPRVEEGPLERYRRLSAEIEYTTTPGEIPNIDDPVRPPCDDPSSTADAWIGYGANDNRAKG